MLVDSVFRLELSQALLALGWDCRVPPPGSLESRQFTLSYGTGQAWVGALLLINDLTFHRHRLKHDFLSAVSQKSS